ncbi:SMC family ATPase [Candidatus Babeliales bacterium]|nr:SMC family ATPase [Candidatus Babeliales bacterium]
MIPIKLELKNFLSYGDFVQTIDFKDYPLICLSGRNGHGKSALLDALTWGIWGQARKLSGKAKAEEDLLRIGTSQMLVSLEFEFNGKKYRVRREFYKTYGKNITNLDFECFSDNHFISLTDKTIRATQKKIETLLNLDFDTFVNSAFLRQGGSNEFSKKTPKERKDILGTILGLGRFDLLKQKAQEYAKKFQDEAKLLNSLQHQAKEELEREKIIISDVVTLKNKLKKSQKFLEDNQKKLEDVEKKKLKALARKQELEIILKEKNNLLSKYEKQKNDLISLMSKWKKAHAQGLLLPDFKVLEKQKNGFSKQENELRDLQQNSLKLQGELLTKKEKYQQLENVFKTKYEKELLLQKQLLEKEFLNQKNILFILDHNQKSRVELITQVSKNELEIRDSRAFLKGQDGFKEMFESKNAQFEKRKAFYQTLIQKGNWIKVSLKDLEHKNRVANDKDNPSCSLCQQALSVRRKQFLAQKFKKEEGFYQHQLIRIKKLIKNLKDLLFIQHDEIKALVDKYDKIKACINKEKELLDFNKEINKKLKEIGKIISEGELQKKSLEEKIKSLEQDLRLKEKNIEKGLDENEQLKESKKSILSLEKEINLLKYDKEKHFEILNSIKDLESKLLDLEETRKTENEQHLRRRTILEFIADLKGKKSDLKELEKNLKDNNFDPREVDTADYNIAGLKKERASFEKKKDEIVLKMGSLESELARIEKIKVKNKENLKRLSVIESEISDYSNLANIFGKDGIQALLIEEAIPEIEDEANTILARLTDNNSQIFIESLRDLKKGGVKETLDIKISDATGLRPYEMFSGGEAFRIDFALRIAISKLLARRAGTALQTLIIDEGFGSQDEEGLVRLMDSIHSISNDFARIIVVSHLPAFKDNFPVHFQVDKLASGSKLSVLLRG